MNKLLNSFLKRKKLFLVIFSFIVAFSVRLFYLDTPVSETRSIDLNFNIDGGQLVKYRINPYNYNEGSEMRDKIRLDLSSYNAIIDGYIEKWNFHVTKRSPLTLIYYSVISKITTGDLESYRIIFAFVDAILSALIVLFLLQFWLIKQTFLNLLLILGMGVFSPTLLLWGTIIPADAGLGILLMILAIYFARGKKWINSAIFLGCSIAFMKVGMFIFPICFYLIINTPNNIFRTDRHDLIQGYKYTILTLLISCIWFVPFYPDVMYIIQSGLVSNHVTEPEHASIWIFMKQLFPNSWIILKDLIIVCIALIWSYQFIYKKIDIMMMSIFVLILGSAILPLHYDLAEMNIGIIISIIAFGLVNSHFAQILGWYSIIAGSLLLFADPSVYNEEHDAMYALSYLLLFSSYPLFYSGFYKWIQSNLKEKLFRIFIRESDKYKGFPLHEVIAEMAKKGKFNEITIHKEVNKLITNSEIYKSNAVDLAFDKIMIVEIADEKEKLNKFYYNIKHFLQRKKFEFVLFNESNPIVKNVASLEGFIRQKNLSENLIGLKVNLDMNEYYSLLGLFSDNLLNNIQQIQLQINKGNMDPDKSIINKFKELLNKNQFYEFKKNENHGGIFETVIYFSRSS
ncbi:MAG: DUF190 domain-containing protein [Bacteroidetes bacterium]|nr:DUF190 domain-containing protein [Bacteroidota bacterium]HET6244978.1 DUF190 domain-containing protein [Bacteroidia bacterium]